MLAALPPPQDVDKEYLVKSTLRTAPYHRAPSAQSRVPSIAIGFESLRIIEWRWKTARTRVSAPMLPTDRQLNSPIVLGANLGGTSHYHELVIAKHGSADSCHLIGRRTA